MGLFSAIGGIIGGLFGGGSKSQKTETTSHVDYGRMVKEATKAGFNPLTALRNGGSAGFSSSTTTHPGLSGIPEVVSQIGGVLGSALDQKIDPIFEQKVDQTERALMNYQLADYSQRGAPASNFGDVPMRKGGTHVVQTVPPLSGKAKGEVNGFALPETQFTAGKAPTVSSVGLEDRFGIKPDPRTGDASSWEQRYAEPGEWVGGLYVMGADAIYNAKRALDHAVDAWKNPQPLAEDSYLLQGARWLDKTLGIENNKSPVLKKGPRLVQPTTTW